MSVTKRFTPGPWTVDDGDNDIRDDRGELIAAAYAFETPRGLERTPETSANARLISAAPTAIEELLAIREECLDWLDGDNKPWDSRLSRIIERIEPILQKAGVL